MIEKIVSGGQTGPGQAALRVAGMFGVPAGGRAPHGFPTEGGPRPEFVESFGLSGVTPGDPLAWFECNVSDSDATLWFGETTTPDAHETVMACCRFGKPCMPIYPAASFEPAHVAAWLAGNEVRTLNVAGDHESESPGIGVWVEEFLGQILQELGHAAA